MDPIAPAEARPLAVKAARLLPLPVITEDRGSLTFGEYDSHLPFPPRRYFVVYDVPRGQVRGEHAHRRSEQVHVCLRGNVAVTVDDGRQRDEVVLEGPHVGLYVPPLVWTTLTRHSEDALLLVLASDVYDPADYIRDYEAFRAEARAARRAAGG
jgi:dTDP-4-dehydrorhamnose 3,5-epimerase-like enzyme